MWPIPLTPLIAALRTLTVPNVSSSSRDLALAALCFLAGGLSLRSLPSSLPPLTQFQVFSTQVITFVLPTCWVQHSLPRLDFSIVDTFAYSRVPSKHSSSPHFGSHVFRGGGVPTLLPQARLPRETISLCWGASSLVDHERNEI